MKNICYFHQYFKTPQEGGAIRSYHIAKNMVHRGFHVDMVTSYNGKKYKIENVEGIMVHYLPIPYSNRFSFLRRSLSFIKYAIGSVYLSRKLAKADLIYATSTPLTVGIIALYLKWKKNIPYIFEVRDLWPAAPIQLGIIKSRLLILILKKLEKKIYKNAKSIIALSPGIKNGILKTNKKSEVVVIPNMSDVNFFNRKAKASNKRNNFKIGYFGAFGMTNNANFILRIAKGCKNNNLDIDFILAGEGSERKSMQMKAENQLLDNIEFTGHVNQHEIRNLMVDVDACITSFMNFPILQTNSPNKFFDGLAAAKLMIVNTRGWLKELVEHHQCGFYINPDQPEEFQKLILPYLYDPELLRKSQKNALKLAKEQFLKEKLVNEICDLLPNHTSIL